MKNAVIHPKLKPYLMIPNENNTCSKIVNKDRVEELLAILLLSGCTFKKEKVYAPWGDCIMYSWDKKIVGSDNTFIEWRTFNKLMED